MSTIQCNGCGKRIIQKGEICPHCGEPIPEGNTSTQSLSRVIPLHNEPNKEQEEKGKQEEQKASNLIACPVCSKQISKNALSCPHCGEPMVQNTTNISSSKESIFGFIGATLLMIGAFLPAMNIPIRGSISYINNGRGDGMLIVLIALLSFYYVYKKKKRSLLLSGGFSLVIITYGFVNVAQKLAEVQKGATSGIEQVFLGHVGVGSAFGVTAVGAILIIISSFMMKKT